VYVTGVPALACGTSTFKIDPRCTLIWKPALVAGASMLAIGDDAAAAALETGLATAALDDSNGVGEVNALDAAAALDAGADAPELTAAEAIADDVGDAVDLAEVQPASNRADATTVPAATTAQRGPRPPRARRLGRGRRLVGVS
jgi:hypothetical protein